MPLPSETDLNQRKWRSEKKKNRIISQQSAKAVIRKSSRSTLARQRRAHWFAALDTCRDLFLKATAKVPSFC